MSVQPKRRRANAVRPSLGDWASLGPKAKAVRVRLGLNMRDLAVQSGVSTGTISRFERGYDTTLSAVVAVCEALGLSFTMPVCRHDFVCRFCGENGPPLRAIAGGEDDGHNNSIT